MPARPGLLGKPEVSTRLANKASVLYHLMRYGEAIETALSARRIQPHAYGFLVLVASHAQLERSEGHWPISAPDQGAARK